MSAWLHVCSACLHACSACLHSCACDDGVCALWLLFAAKEGKEIDARVYDEIERLRPDDAEAVLARFEEANLSKITNTGAFLTGIVRRVSEEGSSDLTRCIDALPRQLRNSFLRLMDEGRLKKGDLESRVATALRVRSARTCSRAPAATH